MDVDMDMDMDTDTDTGIRTDKDPGYNYYSRLLILSV